MLVQLIVPQHRDGKVMRDTMEGATSVDAKVPRWKSEEKSNLQGQMKPKISLKEALLAVDTMQS